MAGAMKHFKKNGILAPFSVPRLMNEQDSHQSTVPYVSIITEYSKLLDEGELSSVGEF